MDNQGRVARQGQGEYIDEQGHCRTCEASCAKCWGPTQEDCTSCPITRVFDDGRCILNCPTSKFELKKQCHPCHHTCQECQGSGPSNCTSCRADKHGRERFLYQGECRESCPVGHYPAKGRACLPCPDNCELCYNPHVCTRCMSGYFIVPTNHTCQKLECRQGEFQDSEYEECIPCEEGCLGCTVDDPGACTSCAAGYYMFEQHCYKVCPEKTFSTEWECRACGTNCGSCDQHECYWCEEGSFLSGGSCVQDCGPGFYGDQELGECEPCHRACETCTGPGNHQCSRCQEDATKQYQPCHSSCKTCNGSATLCTSCPTGTYLWMQACVPSCPQGTWPSVRSSSCENCAEDCAACSGPDLCQKCLSQPDNLLFLHEGRCYHGCPEDFYAKDGVCEHCSSPCRTCEGNATNCHSCERDFVLDGGVCRETCPEKHVAVEGVCQHCPEMCQDCIHEKICKECIPGFFLYDDACSNSCPKHFYPDLRQCVSCHENCLECNGPKQDDCKVCADTSKVLYNGLCLDMCPEGTYKEEENDECKDCPEFCLSCSSAWTCQTCQEGLTKVNEVCTAPKECAAVEYWDEGTHRCQPCHRKCSRCSGPAEDQCYTCPGETLLLNTTCVKSCPEGYHTDKDSHRCVLCHSSCRTCEGPHSMQCRSCRPGWFQLGKECLLQCRDGYYGESTSGRCEKCDKSCKACRGPRPTDCQSCDKFFFLLRSKGQCHRTCPEHYYTDQHTQTCERCHPTCDNCKGKEQWDCLSCVWSYNLLGGICTSECPVGEYRDEEAVELHCKQCHESCVECKGPGAENCTVCPAGLLLHMDDSRCLRCCNASHPHRSQDCCDCQSTTEECILPANEAGPLERTKIALLVTSGAMLLLLLGAAVLVWRKSRSRPVAKGRYEKLAEPTVSYSSYRSSYLDEDQVIEYRDRDYDEDDEDDIVYMGQDGTVYRKFKYGLLDETEEDELEYDDESYSYQ